MNEEIVEVGYSRIHFPLDMIPIQDISKTVKLLNWAFDNGIDIVQVVTAPAMMQTSLVNPAGKGMVTLQFFYGALTSGLSETKAESEAKADLDDQFETIFGFPYAIDDLHNIPKYIQERVYNGHN